ncbi:MAG: 5-oxoprolinase subunit PxpB [Luteolibacter sp.]
MTFKPLGDSAWLVEFPDGTPLGRVMGLASALAENRPPGVRDVVASFASLAVHFDSGDGLEIRDWMEAAMVRCDGFEMKAGGELEIPVCYDGPDLEDVAAQVGMSVEEVIALHSGAVYTVAAVGFSPGFPYLSGLPERLNVPRRETPRLAVPAGSVAIAGGQAGIYPFTSPGGWHVLGRTGKTLFDPNAARPALLQPGDRVRFVAMDQIDFTEARVAEAVELTKIQIEVIQPGGLTTVQDLGRPGYEASGVSPGGAADRQALRMANWLVGNEEGAAALEICLSGPVLKFHADAVVAFVDGSGKPQHVKAGEVVDFSKLKYGVRGYLAVAGGLRVPAVMGSSSTDVRAGFGGFYGRALRAGDRLKFGEAGRVPDAGDWHVGRMNRASEIELRFLPGVQEDWFSAEARQRFRSRVYQLTPRSDRMGSRLSGERLDLESPRELVSQPVACGSVQVPPDGQPIVLLAERQTIGGYPQIGHVISVDLPKLARAWPGTRVKFREVTWEQAQGLKQQEERDFAWLRTGLELLKSKP